jgi:hypothetical protein
VTASEPAVSHGPRARFRLEERRLEVSTLATKTWRVSLDDGSDRAPQLSIEFGVRFGASRPSSWHLELTYDRYPGQRFSTQSLTVTEGASLQKDYPDGVTVNGAINCHFEPGQGCFFETDQLAYGFPGALEYLLGAVVFIPSPGAEPPPPSPPVPDERSTVQEPEISPAATRHGELFPYVYMRTWPEPTPDALARHFVRYPYGFDGPPTGQFLLSLAALHAGGAPDARHAMEELAVRYVEGQVDPDAPFVSDATGLPEPVRKYPEVLELVRRDRGADAEALLHAVSALLGLTLAEIQAYLVSDAAKFLRVRLFQSYFALVVTFGHAPGLRARLAQCLIVDHLLACWLDATDRRITRASIRQLAHASLVLPQAVFPLPPASGVERGAPAGAILPYAIGDLHLVQQRLDRYGFGDIAYVESVMPGERRRSVRRQATRSTRSLERTDVHDATRETLEGSSALRREVSKVLADTIATTTYPNPGFSITYGPTTTLSGGWTQEIKPAEGTDGPSRNASLRDVREVVDRAAARTAVRVAEARSESLSHESEHTSVSEHDNRAGATARRGVYRWLNEVHVAEVVRYGNRFVLELAVPAPGAAYLHDSPALPHAAFPPVPPVALGLRSFEDVRRERFPELSARYPSAELEPPPAERGSVTAFAASGQPLSLTLPEGYEARKATLGYVLGQGAAPLSVRGVLGTTAFAFVADATGVTEVDLKRDRAVLPVLVDAVSIPAGASTGERFERQLSLEVEVGLSQERFDAWRARSFQAVQRAYHAERAAFGAAREHRSGAYVEERHSCGALERGELKRGALELLWRRADTLRGGPPGSSGTARPRYLQFFEHAFEWRELSYSLLSTERGFAQRSMEGDATRRFIAFLEAEFAQLLLPVSPSRALPVLYFLASGTLWDDAHDTVPVHESDLSLACELKHLHDGPPERVPVGEPWELVVPTTLAVLADDCLEHGR